MNLKKLQEKLEKLQQRSGGDSGDLSEYLKLKWKPEDGSTDIRLLPYKHTEDGSFLMVGFYYRIFNGKTLISPGFFGKPDPVVELCNKLRNIQGRSKDEWWADIQVVNKLEPKKRFIAPVLVRGKESEGVKFYEFGVKVFNKISNICENPDYGDIEDLETGTDLTVTYTKDKDDVRKSETEITPRRFQTKVSEDPAVLKAIEDMPNILKILEEPTYDDLKQYLTDYMSTDVKSDNKTAANTTPKPEVPTETKKSQEMADIEADFEKILNAKK